MQADGYYCSEHEAYIKPLIVRVGDYNYPACEDCFLEDLKKSDGKLGDPIDTGIEVEEDELVGEATLEPEDDITEEIVAGL